MEPSVEAFREWAAGPNGPAASLARLVVEVEKIERARQEHADLTVLPRWRIQKQHPVVMMSVATLDKACKACKQMGMSNAAIRKYLRQQDRRFARQFYRRTPRRMAGK